MPNSINRLPPTPQIDFDRPSLSASLDHPSQETKSKNLSERRVNVAGPLLPLSQVTYQEDDKDCQLVLGNDGKGYCRVQEKNRIDYVPFSKLTSIISGFDPVKFQQRLVEIAVMQDLQFLGPEFGLPQYHFIFRENQGEITKVFVLPKLEASGREQQKVRNPVGIEKNPFFGRTFDEVIEILDSRVGKKQNGLEKPCAKGSQIAPAITYYSSKKIPSFKKEGEMISEFLYRIDFGFAGKTLVESKGKIIHPNPGQRFVEMPHIDLIHQKGNVKLRLSFGSGPNGWAGWAKESKYGKGMPPGADCFTVVPKIEITSAERSQIMAIHTSCVNLWNRIKTQQHPDQNPPNPNDDNTPPSGGSSGPRRPPPPPSAPPASRPPQQGRAPEQTSSQAVALLEDFEEHLIRTQRARMQQQSNIRIQRPTFRANLRFNHLEWTYLRSHPRYAAQLPSGGAAHARGEGSKGVEVHGGLITNFDTLCDESLKSVFHFVLPDYQGEVPAFSMDELQQITIELTRGIYRHDAVPFFSLHFNADGLQYPIIHPVYQNTLVGKIILELDYFMKAYIHGGYFPDNAQRKRGQDIICYLGSLEILVKSAYQELCEL